MWGPPLLGFPSSSSGATPVVAPPLKFASMVTSVTVEPAFGRPRPRPSSSLWKAAWEVLELCHRLIRVNTHHLLFSWPSSKPQVVVIQLGLQGRCPPSVLGCWSCVMRCNFLGVCGRLVLVRLLVVFSATSSCLPSWYVTT
jgi:hypothetical protein